MSTVYLFYICPVCFNACEDPQECHEHQMIGCEPGSPDHARRKPVIDISGRVRTRAPLWYLEAMGWTRSGTSSETKPQAT